VRVGGRIDRFRLEIRLDYKDRSRLIATLHGIDQNERVVTLEQLKREMHSANSVVFDLDSGGKHIGIKPARDFDSEAVVGEKDIPDARYHHPVHRNTCVID
jgi:hypothetical protein